MKGPRTLTCDCGRTFNTDAPNRRRCYVCSPSRMPQGFDPTGGNLPDTAPSESGIVVRLPTGPTPADRPEPDHEPGPVTKDVMESLEALPLPPTHRWMRGAALALARDLDSSATSGSQRGTLVNQLTKIMGEITLMAPIQSDELTDIQNTVATRIAEVSS